MASFRRQGKSVGIYQHLCDLHHCCLSALLSVQRSAWVLDTLDLILIIPGPEQSLVSFPPLMKKRQLMGPEQLVAWLVSGDISALNLVNVESPWPQHHAGLPGMWHACWSSWDFNPGLILRQAGCCYQVPNP